MYWGYGKPYLKTQVGDKKIVSNSITNFYVVFYAEFRKNIENISSRTVISHWVGPYGAVHQDIAIRNRMLQISLWTVSWFASILLSRLDSKTNETIYTEIRK